MLIIVATASRTEVAQRRRVERLTDEDPEVRRQRLDVSGSLHSCGPPNATFQALDALPRRHWRVDEAVPVTRISTTFRMLWDPIDRSFS